MTAPIPDVVVHNAVILDSDPATFSIDFADTWIAVADGIVVDRGRGVMWHQCASPATRIIDAEGAYLAPAFVDIHTHGGGGHNVEDGPDHLGAILDVHRAHGTRALVLSYVSDTIAGLAASLRVGAGLARENPAVLGLHAEGPFLSPDFKGAHSPEALTAPTPEAVATILDAADGRLAQVTLAPELPGAPEAIARFVAAGVSVAVGHTAADYAQTMRAFEAGASILTHAFNGMPGIHHRSPGPILAALDAPHVTLELINDGIHVQAPAARLVTGLAPGRVALITDAMAATGMGDGDYVLGSLPVRVEDSVARVRSADGSVGSIAGSTLTMDDAVQRAVAEVGMSPIAAAQAAGLTPLRALGRLAPDVHSLLRVGQPADCVLLDADMRVTTVWIGDRR
ncbi:MULTISPECIES: N-acetylglucosamine-6-phosphate deacetylase [Brevibacterium]|uniref:N-acetylglucosamine-6-phosphate deacetylase n=1 Tax=Brevibacterium TaxID=1696 RepID=UPI001E284417|nr:N-acetylglucosamine-6-phosphate deacetylase [Brevibacterium casei]